MILTALMVLILVVICCVLSLGANGEGAIPEVITIEAPEKDLGGSIPPDTPDPTDRPELETETQAPWSEVARLERTNALLPDLLN
jgi:hypothetical protein